MPDVIKIILTYKLIGIIEGAPMITRRFHCENIGAIIQVVPCLQDKLHPSNSLLVFDLEVDVDLFYLLGLRLHLQQLPPFLRKSLILIQMGVELHLYHMLDLHRLANKLV